MKKQDNFKELTKAIREGSVVPERSGEIWSTDEWKELEECYREGEGISEIALKLQRSEMAVMCQLILEGIMTSPQTRRPRKPKQPQCRCRDCELNPDQCKEICYCLTEGADA